MLDCNLAGLLQPAVSTMLETMFFSELLGPSELDTGFDGIEARVPFSGEFAGTVSIRMSEASARSLAASFLGESDDAISEMQIAQVVCEMTNMVCGWIVSKSGSQGCIDLGSPELVCSGSEPELDAPTDRRTFAVENGFISVSLYPSVRV